LNFEVLIMAKTTGVLTDIGRTHHMLEGVLKRIGAENIFTLDEADGLKKNWFELHRAIGTR
jgi:hypothetical protein